MKSYLGMNEKIKNSTKIFRFKHGDDVSLLIKHF